MDFTRVSNGIGSNASALVEIKHHITPSRWYIAGNVTLKHEDIDGHNKLQNFYCRLLALSQIRLGESI